MTVNELVKLTMFCTTGPRFLHIDIIIMLCMYNVFKEIYRVFKDLSKSISLSDTSQAKLTLKNVLEILRIFARLNMYKKIAVLLLTIFNADYTAKDFHLNKLCNFWIFLSDMSGTPKDLTDAK